jgi:hypothetical protein
MKNVMPTWPQILSICAPGALFCFLGYEMSRFEGGWTGMKWSVAVLLILSGLAFIANLFMFYLRPQYGKKAVPALIFLLTGHAILVAIMVRTGVVK